MPPISMQAAAMVGECPDSDSSEERQWMRSRGAFLHQNPSSAQLAEDQAAILQINAMSQCQGINRNLLHLLTGL
jgi:hypothetical protein